MGGGLVAAWIDARGRVEGRVGGRATARVAARVAAGVQHKSGTSSGPVEIAC